MGFSTVGVQLLFFIAVVGISAGVIAVFADYTDQATGAMGDRQRSLASQMRTDIKITNIDNSSGHLHIYVKNIGSEPLSTSCVSLFIDSGWANLSSQDIVDPSDEEEKTHWLSTETLKLKPSSTQFDHSLQTHSAKVVTCNGVSDTERF